MQIKEVQERLRQIKNTNITQGDIARAIGTTRANVSQLFAKNSNLSDDKIEKIERHFETKLAHNDTKGLVRIPLYSDISLQEADEYIVVSDILNTSPKSLLAIIVNSDSMAPYIKKGDFAVFDRNFRGIEDGRIFLIRFEENFFIKRILNNLNSIILKSDNKDYTDITINSFKADRIEVLARFHSLLRLEG